MLCRKFRQTLLAKKTLINNVQYQHLITARLFSKRCLFFDTVLACKSDSRLRMSSIRFMLRDLSVSRLWGAWTRSFIVNTVVKRCRRDRYVREVFECFRQTILRPRRTFLLSATAVFKSHGNDDDTPPSCEQSITDEELEALMTQLEDVEQLSRSTLFCTGCGKRLVIDKKQAAVPYCACKEPRAAEEAPGGWVPYMEAEDVIIWRKEYKPGQGLYAYKVYGRYKDVRASDFAAVQMDGAYRREWDAAVASLSVVERRANGLDDQAVLHWEVLWPRLFANRDYVYIRRHKEFDVHSSTHSEGVFAAPAEEAPPPPREAERSSVHSRAKRMAQEADRRRRRTRPPIENKAFVIISRSCSHPSVPHTKHAIRVNEYWSHMVVRSIDGAGDTGMEFVLTYYDEPSVGGRCSAVAAWATGRAAAAYLQRMRAAAAGYRQWARARPPQDMPDFMPFGPPKQPDEGDDVSPVPDSVREQDMESSKQGPDMENGNGASEATPPTNPSETTPPEPVNEATPPANALQVTPPTNAPQVTPPAPASVEAHPPAATGGIKAMPEVRAEAPVLKIEQKKTESSKEIEADKIDEEESPTAGSWWRYLYPSYYFV